MGRKPNGKQEEPSIPNILVTGATGTFGAAVAEMLQQAGKSVRVLIRDPARFTGEGVQVAIGDFADPTSLDAALSGVERVFLASFDRPEMPALQRNLVEAAQRQGVHHIARISSMGIDNPHLGPVMADHAAGERQIEQSGIAFTHLRPSWVMQNFLPSSAATPVRDGKIRLPAGDGRIGFVDARDVAAVATVVLTTPGHEGRVYELTGPDALTHAELAEALSAATGLAISYEDLPPEVYVSELSAAGWPPASIEIMDTLFAVIRAEGYAILTDDVEQITGRSPLSIYDFARDHVEHFTA